MKLSEWIYIFIIVFFCFFMVMAYRINVETKANTANIQYERILTAASQDAVKTVKAEKVRFNKLWNNPTDRLKAVEVFYRTLTLGFNTEYTSYEKETYIYTPFVVMIDLDGFYIAFNSAFDAYGNSIRQEGLDPSDLSAKTYDTTITISEINTWSKKYGSLVVRYFLNDDVEVTLPSGYVIADKRKNMHARLLDAANKGQVSIDILNAHTVRDKNGANTMSVIQLMDNIDGIFEIEKNQHIVQQMNEEIEFYVNTYNTWGKQLDLNYDFEMPEIKGEDWHRLLSNPTCISFLQGMQARATSQFLNIYAYAGGEYTRQRQYFITQDSEGPTYHLLEGNCPYHNVVKVHNNDPSDIRNGNDRTSLIEDKELYTCDGVMIEHIYSSMTECARIGAYPCECAINNNH